MKKNVLFKTEPKINNILKLFCLLLLFSITAKGQTLPYEISNNSEYPDNEVYIAIVGITDGHVWVNPINGQVNNMDPSINTVQGPVIDGNQGPGLDGKYANCFRKLSDIPNKTIQIPKIAGCRIMISFKSQLYLYFFGHSGASSGYAAPNLANPTDPNQGIKFELIELTFNDFGLWCNTSRVDAYQYPMGLEVWGNNFYKKVGELKKHNEILAQWQTTAPSEFQSLLSTSEGAIHFPTKVESFPKDFMDGYINEIWSKYSSQELAFTSDAGIWRGGVEGTNFVFRRDSDGQIGTVFGKPTTIEAMEGSGVMASGNRWDLVVQSQMVAAITRHAVDLNMSSGTLQDFGDTSKYYQTWPYNWYSKFFHRTDISFESQTYTFAYDDVYNQSATIHTPNPENIKITLGGFDSTPPDGGFSKFIEAEEYTFMSGVQTEPCSEGGENVGYIDSGDWMAFSNITFPTSGNYLIEYRVASLVNDARFSTDLDAGTTVLGEVSIPNTGGWQNWTTVSHTVNINAGTYPLGVYAVTDGWNINWIKITRQAIQRFDDSDDIQKDDLKIIVYPNPVIEQLNIYGVSSKSGVFIVDVSGKIINKIQTLKGNDVIKVDVSSLQSGTYFIKVYQNNTWKISRFIKK
ncbi:beta-1,3-glucanase family protein [uncultured Aquimarina sp.]|uniref:beta-1,3-glucanase family protein n=1 Tax=uncultured Aquimarina sp. TaxID=575652 RepID=UPI00262160F7|nr:beta-1,3-glucanase family protein [uncultured Aquimarina sp.]